MSRRALIFGAQAVAVGLLVLVVYVTLLRPDDPGTLSGIEAPGGELPQADVRAGGERDSDDRDATPKAKSAARTGSARAGGAVAGVLAAPGGIVGPAAAGTTPPDEQYDDTIAALLARVASADPEGE